MTQDSNNLLTELSCLVVEDNPFTVITLRKALESLGIAEITSASNGQEALDVIDNMKYSPGAILLDLRMPIMGGVELLSRLSDRKYTGCVILISEIDNETQSAVEQLAKDSNINLTGRLPVPPNLHELSRLLMKCTDE